MNQDQSTTKSDMEQKIREALPEKWEFVRLYDDVSEKWAGSFKVTCPIEERMGDPELYHKDIDQICKATNSTYDGGGFMLGGDRYDNFFYIKKDEPVEVTQTEKPKLKANLLHFIGIILVFGGWYMLFQLKFIEGCSLMTLGCGLGFLGCEYNHVRLSNWRFDNEFRG